MHDLPHLLVLYSPDTKRWRASENVPSPQAYKTFSQRLKTGVLHSR